MVLIGLRSSLKIFLWLAAFLCFGSIDSCKKENILPLNLVSIVANGVDLNGTPGGVAVKAPITVTFTTAIDPLSVSAMTVLMTRDYDQAGVPLIFIVSGTLLSIKPAVDLLPGALYTLIITSELKSTHGDPFGSFATTFKTAGRFVPANQVAYWSFDNTTDDLVGIYDALEADRIAITYADGRNDSARQAASFNGITSLIQIANGATLLKPEFTISFWMKLISINHVDDNGKQKGSFVIGIGNTHGLQFDVEPNYAWCRFSQGFLLADLKSTTTNDFKFPANGATKDNIQNFPDSVVAHDGIDNATVFDQDFGSTGLKQRLDNVWANITMTFEDTTKTRTLYINGEKMYQQNLSLLGSSNVNPALQPLAAVTSLTFVPDTDIPPRYDDHLVFGFWQNKESTFGGDAGTYSNVDANHFQGLLDDVRIFNRALSETEVSLIYEGEK